MKIITVYLIMLSQSRKALIEHRKFVLNAKCFIQFLSISVLDSLTGKDIMVKANEVKTSFP